MRLSTRFGLVAALAVLPLLGVLVYSVLQLRSLAQTNESLATRQLVGVRIATDVSGRLPRLEEFQQKFAVSEDAGYRAKYRETAEAIGAELRDLAGSRASADAEGRALAELMATWDELDVESGPATPGDRADALTRGFATLQDLASDVRTQAELAARAEVRDARRARRRTQQLASWVAALAVAASLFLLAWAVRTLRTRLEDLTQATAAVSLGQFTYRMPTGGNDELSRVAASFNRMVVALNQLDRMKQDFVSSISHELRTPIVAIQETNNLLLDEVPGTLNAKQRRMLELNAQAAARLSTMIGDLLDLGRVKAGIEYRMGHHDLGDLTRRACNELEALAFERRIRLRVAARDDVQAVCDADRFVQVVQNLVENGLKHCPNEGYVHVTLEAVQAQALPSATGLSHREGSYGLLTVMDNGPGIPAEDRERVFDKFFRRQGQPADAGVGLGLAICREIVAAHDGAIWVGDDAKPGAVVRAAIPLDPTDRGGLP